MTTQRLSAGVLGSLLVLASAGCAGTARVESRKSADYAKKLERVLIAVRFERLGQDFEKAFKTRFVEVLKKCGTEGRFAITESDLALEPAPSLEKQAKDFQASCVLILNRAGGVVSSYGGLVRADFDGQLFDLALKKRVWRAQINYTPGGSALPVNSRADVLIDEIIKAMAADGLVKAPPPRAARNDGETEQPTQRLVQ